MSGLPILGGLFGFITFLLTVGGIIGYIIMLVSAWRGMKALEGMAAMVREIAGQLRLRP